MSAAAIKKRPPPNANGYQPSINPSPSHSMNSRGPSPSTPASANGLNRSRSIKGPNGTPASARAAAKRPGLGTSNLSNSNIASEDPSEEDARAETVALIDELKLSLRKAETASEEYQRQLTVLQSRLDDALNEQGKLEEQFHESTNRMTALDLEKRDSLRQMKDVEAMYESERAAMMKEKEQQDLKEEELQSVIRRLKETLAQRDMRLNVEGDGALSRSCRHISIQGFSIITNTSQRAFEADLLQILKTDILLLHRRCNAAIRETTQSWYCRRIDSSNHYAWNWPKRRSRLWKWNTWEPAGCMSWRRTCWNLE